MGGRRFRALGNPSGWCQTAAGGGQRQTLALARLFINRLYLGNARFDEKEESENMIISRFVELSVARRRV
jgi:hypothetical protein